MYKTSIVRHFERNNLCEIKDPNNIHSNYHLKYLSLQRTKESIKDNNNNNFICEKCNKKYSTNFSLKRHIEQNICNKKINNTTESNVNNITNNNITNNITNNNTNNNNTNITNQYFINMIEFDKPWNVDDFSKNLKYALFSAEFKYSETLNEIMKNVNNHNVIIDNDEGYIYKNNNFEQMPVDEIYKKTIDKIYEHLNDFYEELRKDNYYNNRGLDSDRISMISGHQRYKYKSADFNKVANNAFKFIFDEIAKKFGYINFIKK